jgi:EmrB/QacA subfamily drug resistance transporter
MPKPESMMTSQQRLVVWIAILASFVSFLDGTVVNVALPAISRELGGGLLTQQWVVDAYALTLGALILLAGALSDSFGRLRIVKVGLIGFAVTSLLCAVAPSAAILIISRALQGVFGALLVPSSLALIISTFKGAEQGKAIGTWTAWTGIAFLIGPLVGGFFVDAASWRWIFAINVLPVAVTLWLISKLDKPDPQKPVLVDYRGAALCTLGLGGTVYALIEQAHYGWQNPLIYVPFLVGIGALVWFGFYERNVANPVLPLQLFKERNFLFGNLATVAIYAGLAVSTFLLIIFIQQFGGYSAVGAGLAMLPVTVIMFFLSPRFGALAGRFGPRLFMTIGPIIAACGFLLMLRINADVRYWSQLFPAVVGFGLGLSMTVAPLTSAVLASIHPNQAGIASAVNNAISRIAGLVAIAAIGLVTGTTLSVAGFHRGVVAMAVLLIAGGIISLVGIRNPVKTKR